MARKLVLLAAVAGVLAAVVLTSSSALGGGGSSWVWAGHDLQNTRYQNAESKIGVANVANLAVTWQFATGGDVSATPAVDGSTVYVPDWAGNLYALDQKTGRKIWSHQVSEYTGIAGDFSTTTPAIFNGYLIFGDQGGRFGQAAWIIAVSKQTGTLVWKTQAESGGAPVIMQSAVIDASSKTPVAYVGVASVEDLLAAVVPGYVCCSFRGSMLALDASTGQILWKTYTVPVDYSGGAVSGSTGVIDHPRNSLYFDTGHNYSVPQGVLDCVAGASGPDQEQACSDPSDQFDSVMALDLATGAVRWVTRTVPFDAWNFDCIAGLGSGSNCPAIEGPAYGFDQGPALFTVRSGGSGKTRDLVGAGAKSGRYWAFDPGTGAVVWVTQVGPGGKIGGSAWGSATDGKRVYVAIANDQHKPWPPGTAGGWSALDAATGQILWQTADPTGGIDPGAVSAANGVVYGCSLDALGHMYAFDAATGAVKWSFASGGSCNAGAAISNGTVYWGSGYGNLGLGTPNDKVFAFRLP